MPYNSERRNENQEDLILATRKVNSWKDDFASAVEKNSLGEAIAVLDSQKTAHAGTPRQAIKLQAAKLVSSQYGESAQDLYNTAITFGRSESEGAQEVGLVLLGHLYAHNPTEVTDTILKLADSGNWEVREWAASALRRVISGHFGAILPTVQAWTVHASPNIRRAAAVGCGSAASSCTPDECRLLLDALTPLLEDDDPYVRKNLGAFAIGDSLLKAQPALVAEWLGQASSHPRAQWNVAMALSSAEAAKHFDLLRELLRKVAADDRTVVRRAVYRAVLNLAKRIPEKIAALVEAWEEDSQRSHVYVQVKPKLR